MPQLTMIQPWWLYQRPPSHTHLHTHTHAHACSTTEAVWGRAGVRRPSQPSCCIVTSVLLDNETHICIHNWCTCAHKCTHACTPGLTLGPVFTRSLQNSWTDHSALSLHKVSVDVLCTRFKLSCRTKVDTTLPLYFFFFFPPFISSVSVRL